MNQEQPNQVENNMSDKKNKSRKDSMNALATMGANMEALMSGDSLLAASQSHDIDETETETVETTQPPVQEGESEMTQPTPVEVSISIDKTQGNAIYSSLLGIQSTLDNFKLDVRKDSLHEVVNAAIKEAVSEYLAKQDKESAANEEKLRKEGKPANALEAYTMATKRSDNAIEKFNKNSRIIQQQYKSIVDCLCELLGRANLYPYEKPKFKDENGHILLNSLYLYPWYCVKCFYSSRYVRGFFKFVAWSIWLICIGLLLFIARDNAILKKQQNINRYVHAYFSDNAEVMMELEGIDLMFSDQEVMPMPIKDYRVYMKERKKGMKSHKESSLETVGRYDWHSSCLYFTPCDKRILLDIPQRW